MTRLNIIQRLEIRLKKFFEKEKGKEKFFDRINYLEREKKRKEILIQKTIKALAQTNKLTRKKCVMCPNFMQAKKQKYCSNKCARKAEKKLAKLRRIYGKSYSQSGS